MVEGQMSHHDETQQIKEKKQLTDVLHICME